MRGENYTKRKEGGRIIISRVLNEKVYAIGKAVGMSTQSTSRAFSLIELLVVVGIVSILASIALINFGEAGTRAKVSRAHADMRTLRVALETYRADYNDYPANAVIPQRAGGQTNREPNAVPPMYGYPVAPRGITTPVAYVTNSPSDPFRANGTVVYDFRYTKLDDQLPRYNYIKVISPETWGKMYLLGDIVMPWAVDESVDTVGQGFGFNHGALQKYGQWAVVAAGPDHVMWRGREDFQTPGNPASLLNAPVDKVWGYSFDIPYDPTNGTTSFGNIFVTQLGMKQPFHVYPDTTIVATNTSTGGGGDGAPPNTGQSTQPTGQPTPTPEPLQPGQRRMPRGMGRIAGRGEASSNAGAATMAHEDHGGGNGNSEGGRGAREGRGGVTATATPTPIAVVAALAPRAELTRALQDVRAVQNPARPSSPRHGIEMRTLGLWLLFLALLLLAYALWRWFNRNDSALAQARARLGERPLAELSNLQELEELDLSHSGISDEGMALLAGLPRLENLCLWDTLITDIGINELHSLENLRTLNLSETQVSDAGMTNLERFPALHTLILTETAVSDAAIPELLKLTKLHNLALRGTQITPEGLAQLREALPRCAITHSLDDAIRPLATAQ